MNRIPAAEFRSEGEQLKVDEQININHTFCPAGEDTKRRLYIRRKSDCILAYCHNCGGYGFVSLGNKIKRLEELVADNEELLANGTPDIALPEDMKSADNWSEWPVMAKSWLRLYHLGAGEAYRNGIGYSPSLNRLILPVYRDGKLIFWQGRAVSPIQTPKYFSVKAVPKPLFVPQGKFTCGAETVFIVEDMLSAIRIAEYAPAIALLGTSAAASDLLPLLEKYYRVNIWFDPDTAGREKALELHRQLNLAHGGSVLCIKDHRQPKEHTPDDLQRTITSWT